MTFRRQICKTITQFTKVLDRLSTENEEYDTDLRQRVRQHHEKKQRTRAKDGTIEKMRHAEELARN